MFLKTLGQEERLKFVELAFKIANCDGNYVEEEKELMDQYKSELEISKIPETDSIDGLISFFACCSENIQKIVWFELCGVLMADEILSDAEEEICDKIIQKFTLSDENLVKIKNAAIKLQQAYDAVYDSLL